MSLSYQTKFYKVPDLLDLNTLEAKHNSWHIERVRIPFRGELLNLSGVMKVWKQDNLQRYTRLDLKCVCAYQAK